MKKSKEKKKFNKKKFTEKYNKNVIGKLKEREKNLELLREKKKEEEKEK